MSYRTIADPYNSRLQQVEESLNRSRRNLAQQQQYGSTTPASPYYTNSMANVGNVYHNHHLTNTTDARNNMTSQLVADVRQLEQQRSLLLEESRRRNYDQAGMHRARTQQLQHATRYETDLRAEQVLQRQRESQMRSHVYNTLSTLPTTYAAAETSLNHPYDAYYHAQRAAQAQQAHVQAAFQCTSHCRISRRRK